MRLDRYEARTSLLMTVLAFVFLVLYGIPVIWPDLPETAVQWLGAGNFVIWTVFAADLVVRVALAERRWHYLLRHPIDVATVLLPMLRPLRILRVFTAGHSLLTRRGGLVRTGQAVLLSALVLVVVGALAVLDAEQDDPGAVIASLPDALWWAITTVTTVGYGDLYPVTGIGRTVAAALMLVGISVLGVLTASVAAWFIGPDPEPDGSGPGAQGADRVLNHLRALHALHADGVLSQAELTVTSARLLQELSADG